MGCARSHDLRNTGRWYRKTLNGVEVRCCNACVKTVNNHVKFPRGGVTVCVRCDRTETCEFRVVKGTGIVCCACELTLRKEKKHDAGIKCVECKQLNRPNLTAVAGEAGAHICGRCAENKHTKELNDAETKCALCGEGNAPGWRACPGGFSCNKCRMKERSEAKKQKK
jgi:hypothetical protein